MADTLVDTSSQVIISKSWYNFLHIKNHLENPGKDFIPDQIMYLHSHSHKFALTRNSFCNELSEGLVNEKVVINLKNNGEQYFKWAVIATSHHEMIK